MPLVVVERRETAAASRRAANDMNDDIDAAELLQHGVGNSRGALGGGDIGSYEEIVRREMIGPFACRDEHGRARFAQTRHDSFADALCAACNERALSGKVEIAAHQSTSSALISPSAEKPKR
jgi:hypothetical protein